MNTQHRPLTALDLHSIPLAAVPDLTTMLQTLAGTLGDGIPDLTPTLARLLAGLDAHLHTDPLGGHSTFVDASTSLRDALDRQALLELCRSLTVPLPATPAPLPATVPAPQPKRGTTAIETLVIRYVATDARATIAVAIAGLESGATPTALAHLPPAGLRTEGSRFTLALPGTAHNVPRTIEQPRWAASQHAHVAASRVAKTWLLHNSRATDPQDRISCLLMAIKKTLRATQLPTADTLTADSIRRTGLRNLALHGGPEGWDRAMHAAGYRTPDAAEQFMALHSDP